MNVTAMWKVCLHCVLIATATLGANQVGSAPSDRRALTDLAYLGDGHERHMLDLFVPKAHRPVPLIVWLHGGGWMRGSKSSHPMLAFAKSFVDDGFAVASINYRLSSHATFPAQLEDCRAAVRWLYSNAGKFGIDPTRIAIIGQSAGGFLAALLGTSGDIENVVNDRGTVTGVRRARAIVDFFGPTDFLQIDRHQLPGGEVADSPDSPESRLIGGPIQERRTEVAKSSPLTYVSSDDPPFLIFHGDQDLTVPHHQSELLYSALRTAGVPAQFHTVQGAGHSGPAFTTPEIRRLVREFLNDTLGTPSP